MNPRVAIGYVHDFHGGSHSFQHSYREMRSFDAKHGRLIHREVTAFLSKVDGLSQARNEIVRQFLAAGDCDWLLMVDRDMGFKPDALYKLLAVADPDSRPMVGGLTFAAWRGDPDGMGGWRIDPLPVLMQWRDDMDGGPGLGTMEVYPADALVPAAATGAAFLLVHRSVLEKVGAAWFTPTMDMSGRMLGEDISFCVRAGRSGFPLFIHTGVRTSHHKEVWLSEVDYWRSYRPPPATREVKVAILNLSEAGRSSLRASTGLAHLVEDGDEFTGWTFLSAVPVLFGPGWLDHAQHVADVFDAQVVAAGPGVLVRDSFWDSFTGGDVEEIIAAAKERKVFATALGAAVERESDDAA